MSALHLIASFTFCPLFFTFPLCTNETEGREKWLCDTHMYSAGIVVGGDDADAFTSPILGSEFPERHALDGRARSPVHRIDGLVGKVPTKTLQMQRRKSRGKMTN